jgi:hypothetical protein
VKFTESRVIERFEAALAEAERRLASLDVAQGRRPTAMGLSGWVFEQTVRYCLGRELDAAGHHCEIRGQVPLKGRARVDLLAGRAAIELKARGSFGAGDAKYSAYRKAAEERGWAYLYLTMQEGYAPYRLATASTFGGDHAFFLDEPGDWSRFVDTVRSLQA